MIKIKLIPIGKKRAIKYRVVVAEENSKVTGNVIDLLGYYLPKEKKLDVDLAKLKEWMIKGAQPTPSARKLCQIS